MDAVWLLIEEAFSQTAKLHIDVWSRLKYLGNIC